METTQPDMETMRIGFIGGGNMAEAIIGGLVAQQVVAAGRITVYDPVAERCRQLETAYGITAAADNTAMVKNADVVVLAVKPQVLSRALGECGGAMGPEKLLISVVAGASTAAIAGQVAAGTRIVRTIPNTPLLVRAGAVAIANDSNATAADLELTQRIFSACGRTVLVEEKLIDAATGLSGSGPAFVFQVIEALADGGVLAGLSRDVAQTLAAQTVMGAAKMVLESGRHPGRLKDMVASPAGTTINGLYEMETRGVRGALMSAVQRAAERSRQLGQNK